MIIKISEKTSKEEILLQLENAVESIKEILENVIDELEDEGEETQLLNEAYDSLDYAVDAIEDGVARLGIEKDDPDEENG